jgi:hypothetical protein
MATTGPQSTQRSMSIEIDGKRVPLSPEGLERAQSSTEGVGKKLVEAVRTAVDGAAAEE